MVTVFVPVPSSSVMLVIAPAAGDGVGLAQPLKSMVNAAVWRIAVVGQRDRRAVGCSDRQVRRAGDGDGLHARRT